MRAGPMRHTLSIYDPAGAADSDPDGFGEPDDEPTLHATRRCSIITLKGAELIAAHREQGMMTHKIRMRYVAGVLPRMYGVDQDGAEYDFVLVNNVCKRKRWLLIHAKERI